jgi:hypothetical protein
MDEHEVTEETHEKPQHSMCRGRDLDQVTHLSEEVSSITTCSD